MTTALHLTITQSAVCGADAIEGIIEFSDGEGTAGLATLYRGVGESHFVLTPDVADQLRAAIASLAGASGD